MFSPQVDEDISPLRRFRALVILLELKGRRTALMLICALALVQCILRFVIAAVVMGSGWPATERVMSGDVQAFVIWMFVAIGAVGLLTTYGLWNGSGWGFLGTIGLSVVTIVFDQWAIVAVQPSALLGVVLPVVFIAYLIWKRASFGTGVRSIESAGGLRH